MANLHNGISDERTAPESPLDDDRAASMADEGGFSGALMDLDDLRERRHLLTKLRRSRRSPVVRNTVVALSLLAAAGFVIGWWRRTA